MIPNIFRRHVKVAAVKLLKPVLMKLAYNDTGMFMELVIEIQSECNRKCNYCPNSKYSRPYKELPTATFKDIINQLAEINYRHWISFIGFGEPTKDKRLPDLVEYAKERLPKAMIRVFTNGDFLTPSLKSRLKKSGVDIIVSSHDTNLKSNNMMNMGGLVEVENNCMKGRKTCIYPLFRCNITAAGNVTLCCGDYFGTTKMGNVKEEKLLLIWKRTEKFRHDIAKGKTLTNIPLCRACTEAGKDENNTD